MTSNCRPPLLTDADLAAIREDMEDVLSGECTVCRATPTSDGMGGYMLAWADVETVACHIAPGGQKPEERVIAERLAGVTAWTVKLPAGTDVTAKDRLVTEAHTYEVVAVLSGTVELVRRVLAIEVA